MSEKKNRIGLISDFISSEYADNLIRGITTYCIENDLELILFPIGDLKKSTDDYLNYNYQFSSILSQVRSDNLDGIIVTSGTLMHGVSEKYFINFLRGFKPLKIVNIAAKLEDIPCIEVDCNQAFDALLQYLIDVQKCRKFALMGVDSQSVEVTNRTKIFGEVLERNNSPLDKTVFWNGEFEYSEAYHAINAYYKDHGKIDFDAIIALNDDMAFACVDYCTKRAHMNVPEDIIITGFDNMQRASFSNPTMTSVNQQIEFLGYSAARSIHQSVRGKKVPLYQTIRAKTILRNSTAKNKAAQENFQGNNYISVDLRTSKDFSNQFSVSEWYNRRSQIIQAANYYANINSNCTIDDLGYVITDNLRTFGFQAAALVLYEHPVIMPADFEIFPLPRKARVLAGFDYTTMFNVHNFKEPVYFNPHECLLPPELFNFPSCGTIAVSVFYGTCHYGYLLLRLNNYDSGVYELIQKATSIQIQGAYNFMKIVEEQSLIKNEKDQLDIIAHTDELTGLRNRRGFLDLGQASLSLSKEMGGEGLVVYCDMDGLKKINDTYGHESGDIAIKAQANILSKAFRSNDVIGRLGGDEFALICPGLTEEKLKKIKDIINKACKTWKKTTKSPFDLSISMGCIKYPTQNEGYRMESLLSLADNYLYLEKRAKKGKK